MRFDIVSIGALLVEIMRKDKNQDFNVPAEFMGPFPSGDTPIFINAASKLGFKCGFIGTVGNDGFGQCVIERLQENHVDTECIRVIDSLSTAVTFIAYFTGGNRKFLYHLHNAAAGDLRPSDVKKEYVSDTKWVHLTGFGLSGSVSSREAALKILDYIPDSVQVSFDPNIRTEALSLEELREISMPVIERCSVFLPSEGEAKEIMGMDSDEEACRYLASQGKIVAQKLGPAGSRIYAGDQVIAVPSFPAVEVDPTGAGDTFSAAFIGALIEGKDLYDAGLFANTAAMLSIGKKGPMEGAPSRAEVDDFLKEKTEAVI